MTAVLRSPSSISCNGDDGLDLEGKSEEEREREADQLSVLALVVTAVRKSLARCRTEVVDREGFGKMEIGWPTNVRHVAHVTFDRFHGFLGLPVELETEVPRKAPSASANIFGVSTESMQCSYDSRGNSVPTILMLMQSRLYEQGGLQAEGIFRINAENSQEELVRDRLNNGVVPGNIDVHCLAGLIKAWFRELPTGVLDSLEPDQVMQCETEESCSRLLKLLPQSEAALLDWAVNLMADVVQEEQHNKMNARNIAMVFAPNMTQMADPLTALMYAVQVMNFLKMLIEKALKEREEAVLEGVSVLRPNQSDEEGGEEYAVVVCDTASSVIESSPSFPDEGKKFSEGEEAVNSSEVCCEDASKQFQYSGGSSGATPVAASASARKGSRKKNLGQLSNGRRKKGVNKEGNDQGCVEKAKGVGAVCRLNVKVERAEAWR